MNKIALAVHGGAWEIPDEAVEACREGCRRALARGWEILTQGGTALDACEEAIALLEDDPIFDAGVGSHLNRDGQVQLDAILMDGRTLKAGAVAAVERIRNPVRVARLVLERSPHMMLVGRGAEQFAVEHGLMLCKPAELVVAREVKLWQKSQQGATAERGQAQHSGTVGAVALDAAANLAAGTSTGGSPYKYPGRVGDSPLIGCGCYADNLTGAISATGDGEAIMKVVLAKTAADLLAAGVSAQEAAQRAVALLGRRTDKTGGLIIVDPAGRLGAAFSTPRMALAYRTANSRAAVVKV